jgi:hypothetical protein
MTNPRRRPWCRKHGSLIADGVCSFCYVEDITELRREFGELVSPLRAEGGAFARVPRLGDVR